MRYRIFPADPQAWGVSMRASFGNFDENTPDLYDLPKSGNFVNH